MDGARLGRVGPAAPRRQRDVESSPRLAALAARNRKHPRPIRQASASHRLGNIQADAGPRPNRLIPQPNIGDFRFANALEELSRLLVSLEPFMGELEEVRHRRLLSPKKKETAMTNDCNGETKPAAGAAFSLPYTLQAQCQPQA